MSAKAPKISRNPIREEQSGAGRQTLAAVPAVGLALLPKISCPACWPAYAGLFSSLGLGAMNYGPYLLPLTLASLALMLAALAFRAKRRRGYGPFGFGLIGALILLTGKFWLGWEAIAYGGIMLLVGASIWNAWPRDPTFVRLSLPPDERMQRGAQATRRKEMTL